MRLKDGAHLTYSTAVHPGEIWSEIRAQLVSHAPAVKRLISPDQPFGMGLRLSAAAARSLAEPRQFAEFQEFLEGHGLYVFTMSGGPYGSCHEPRIKDGVYLPDWQDERRLDFADRLAWLLSRLLPEDVAEGTITTIPGAFKGHVPSPGAIEDMADRMIRHVATLFRLYQETGRCIVLAIEPEPCCLLETVEETISFFQNHLFAGASRLAGLLGISWPAAEIVLRRHLGLCLDACHVALQFEEPLPAVLRLRAAGIRIVKVQISAGLRLTRLTPAALAALGPFVHDMELHQVVEQGTAGLWRH
ncbi:MAG: metabolite traffic protein EboE, partial [Rhodospirillales bacterium]|nr:metabolite traffic protein EboE [Rhodospirillales bacterium]